ncbi:hypothetical protein CU098_008089 [Rhizopus stolonifer]|uniref:PHD-type domain-containing protein n=1 Tax=Rhizopus stolonifer TaxID=4846 RepID=A0A367JK12_RHIST|nr:hypothetical protein CU098_008089 [Rhizopus stolonifer]
MTLEPHKQDVPTVLSQSFSSINNIWDAILPLQLDQNTFAKPIGDSSPDMYHECHPAALPIGGPRMATHHLILGPTLNNLIKDDVFLAQPYFNTIDHDDNASLSSHSSSSQHSDKLTSPCLSPVTSPTNFLHHEPLFDGGIVEESKESYTLYDQDCFKLPNAITSESTDYQFDFTDTEDETMKQQVNTVQTDHPKKPRQKRRKKCKTAKKWATVEENMKKKKLLLCKPMMPRRQLIEPMSAHDTKTVFQYFTETSIDWCRYCGTTEGVNWRPGPWGKRTLCNKHGCDYKGYGLASRLPRLDLSAFSNEKLEDRLRPVVQYFCIVCQSPEQVEDNQLVLCQGGCSRAYHQKCHAPTIPVNPTSDGLRWYCSTVCKENLKRNKVDFVVVELPRKHMPMMHLLNLERKN